MPNSPTVQHFLEMFSNLIQEWQGYLLELLLERFFIQELNYMLGGIHAPYLIFVQG